jgi:hypothetical protein
LESQRQMKNKRKEGRQMEDRKCARKIKVQTKIKEQKSKEI